MLGLETVVRSYVAWTIRQRGGLTLAALEAIWPIVVGRALARRTRPKRLQGGRLDVGVPDGIWASELRFQEGRILARLNRVLPESMAALRSIRFSVGGHPEWLPESSEVSVGAVVPLTDEQRQALDDIADPALRALVAHVIERDTGRQVSGEGEEDDV